MMSIRLFVLISLILLANSINIINAKNSNSKKETQNKNKKENVKNKLSLLQVSESEFLYEKNLFKNSKEIKLTIAILANPEPINGGEQNPKKQGVINSTNVDWLNDTIHSDFILEEIRKNFEGKNSTQKNFIKNSKDLKISAEFVPLFHWQNDAQIEEILNNVNGILFTGGNRHVNFELSWEKFMLKVSHRIMERQAKGQQIPLFGICQGFELFHAIIVNSTKIFGDYDGWEEMLPTEFIPEAKLKYPKRSIFNYMTQEELNFLARNKSLTHFHFLGIDPEDYEKDSYKNLKNIFQVLSYAYDRKGKKFVDTIESLAPYNMYGVQFHPEKDPISLEGNTQAEKESFLKQYRKVMSKLAINFYLKAIEDEMMFRKNDKNEIQKEQNKYIESIRMKRSDRVYTLHGKKSYPIYLFSE